MQGREAVYLGAINLLTFNFNQGTRINKLDKLDKPKLTPQQQAAVEVCAEKIRSQGRGKQGLIIWSVCKERNLDTKPIAQALQKRGTSVKKAKGRAMSKEFVDIDVTTVLDDNKYKAVLFDAGLDENIWIPRSIMGVWPGEGEDGIAEVQRWFAENNELI